MNIFVGNLNYKVREEAISELFAEFGEVTSVKIVKDQETGRSRGFAFVEMPNDSEAKEAINELHETEFHDRALVVNEAKPRTDSGNSRGGNGGFRNNRRN
jgi:RNA recognition motif-containing protein